MNIHIALMSISLLTCSSLSSFAQSASDMLELFSPVSVPYELPTNAQSVDGVDDEYEIRGIDKDKKMDAAYLMSAIGYEVWQDQSYYYAIDKIEYKDITILILLNESVNSTNGRLNYVYDVFTISKEGKFMSEERACESSSYISYEGENSIYSTSDVYAEIGTMGNEDGDIVLVLMKSMESFEEVEGNFGQKTTTVSSSYYEIKENGEIVDATIRIEE